MKETKVPKKSIDGRTISAKKTRVTKEETRLNKIFSKLPPDLLSIGQGLIRRAAHMRITLEDYEKDIDENGTVDLFRQSSTSPTYERTRPVVTNYNSLNKNYQSIIKQLSDLLPKGDEVFDVKKTDDGFDAFVDKKQ